MEIEQASLFGEQESEILLRRDLGNLTKYSASAGSTCKKVANDGYFSQRAVSVPNPCPQRVHTGLTRFSVRAVAAVAALGLPMAVKGNENGPARVVQTRRAVSGAGA